MPFGASMLALAVLDRAVFSDQREQLVGKGNAATARAGLDLDFD
jgi:hypothetical protein